MTEQHHDHKPVQPEASKPAEKVHIPELAGETRSLLSFAKLNEYLVGLTKEKDQEVSKAVAELLEHHTLADEKKMAAEITKERVQQRAVQDIRTDLFDMADVPPENVIHNGIYGDITKWTDAQAANLISKAFALNLHPELLLEKHRPHLQKEAVSSNKEGFKGEKYKPNEVLVGMNVVARRDAVLQTNLDWEQLKNPEQYGLVELLHTIQKPEDLDHLKNILKDEKTAAQYAAKLLPSLDLVHTLLSDTGSAGVLYAYFGVDRDIKSKHIETIRGKLLEMLPENAKRVVKAGESNPVAEVVNPRNISQVRNNEDMQRSSEVRKEIEERMKQLPGQVERAGRDKDMQLAAFGYSQEQISTMSPEDKELRVKTARNNLDMYTTWYPGYMPRFRA